MKSLKKLIEKYFTIRLMRNTKDNLQLALKLHPDKNRAPKATDAFKKLSQAFACLSDADKRSKYD